MASRQGIDIDKKTGLAKHLRPDVVTLAVMEAGPTELTARLSQVRQQLTGSEIAAELMILGLPTSMIPLSCQPRDKPALLGFT
jgi:hypothetical protein